MTMLEIHKQALSGEQTLYHEFLSRYKGAAKCVYGFVEGMEDPSFYRGAIQNYLGQDWIVEMWLVGNKEKVIRLYKTLDWRRFKREKVLFFIDQDLSPFLGETLPKADNVYVTDKYSIENDIVGRHTCDRVLTEVCNLNVVPKNEMSQILDLFDDQLTTFQENMVPVMVQIISWKRCKLRPNLDNIEMKHMFQVKAGKLGVNPTPKGLPNWREYIHNRCGIKLATDPGMDDIEAEFRASDGPRKFIRGKYQLWFMVEFVLSVRNDVSSFSASVQSAPKMHVSLSIPNAIIIIGPRAQIPESLDLFLNRIRPKNIDAN